MGTSIFIARIFGLCYLIIGACFIMNRKAFQQVMEDFCKNAAMVFYGGLLALVIGVVIVLKHNIWAANWTVIITIIGWVALIKGIWMIGFPGSVPKFMRAYRENKNLIVIHAVFAIVFGAVLAYFGFFAG
ncbi:hypothetical protein ACFL42_01695 [Candidatus Omnitrophota bacterium]